MAMAVIIILYIGIGVMASVGAIAIARKLFSARGEQIFFGLALVVIASFYLAFVAHFGNLEAWRLETGAVAVFAVLGIVGCRVSLVLALGYVLHGGWDLAHDLQAWGMELGLGRGTEIPLGYGPFCATFDLCVGGYLYTRRRAARGLRS